MSAVEARAIRTTAATRLLTGGAMVVAGTAVFQASNFAFNSIAARALGPVGYGDLAAVIGIVYLVIRSRRTRGEAEPAADAST